MMTLTVASMALFYPAHGLMLEGSLTASSGVS
jgi:hypothetical protein